VKARSILVPAAGALALTVTLGAAGSGRAHGGAFPYGAPPGVTGGFGESTCMQCHFDGELNAAGGTLAVEGLPQRYTPGETYRLIVRLRRGEMGAAGFQLSARTAAGAQAGELRAAGRAVQVQAGGGGVQYAGHTEAGSAPAAAGSAEWAVQWVAPAASAGPVSFHVAANSANGDRSPTGDHVYALERRAAPR
jgi:hypothetical protein